MNTSDLKKLGVGGALIGLLCCAAGPLLVGGLAAIGVGWALPDLEAVLLPVGLAGVLLYGYARYREHRACATNQRES